MKHIIFIKNIVPHVKIINPLKFELCVRSMLYDFRYKDKDKKDFYICDLKIIKDQIGGDGSNLLNTLLIDMKNSKEKIINKIEKLEKILNK